MNKPVLILGGSARIGVTIARSLHRHSIAVDWAALSSSSPRVHSRAIRDLFVLPDFRQAAEEFRCAVSDLIEKQAYDLLIPANDSALSALAHHYDWLSARVALACPRPEIVDRILDKNCVLEAARQCGIPIPATRIVSGVSELKTVCGQLRLPLAIKPCSVKHENAFQVAYLESCEQIESDFGQELSQGFLVQEYFRGEGVGVEYLVHNGQAVAVFQHRRLKELPSTGGVSVLAESEPIDTVLAQYGAQLLRRLEWEGAAMVEFRARKSDGTAVLMEVNGRPWGSISLPVAAGVDVPYYIWQLAHGEQPSVPAYSAGIRVRWTMGELRRLEDLFTTSRKGFPPKPSPWGELVKFGRDLLPPTRDAVWSLRDPLPAIMELTQGLRQLCVARVKASLRKHAPERVVSLGRIYRQLGPRDGRIYLKLQLLRAFHLRRADRRPHKGPLRSVVFVCHGNIIRSPMAAALLRSYLSDTSQSAVAVISAGLHAKPQRRAEPRARSVAKGFGISLDDHWAQPITDDMIRSSDAVFVMDFLNEAQLLGRYPWAAGKVFLLKPSGTEPGSRSLEIADPYDGDTADVDHCYRQLQSRIRHLASVMEVTTKSVS
jgi:protein-tyrosine-phosphatase/predicted ATP-grasp superfamily ATP-dependent carboligase